MATAVAVSLNRRSRSTRTAVIRFVFVERDCDYRCCLTRPSLVKAAGRQFDFEAVVGKTTWRLAFGE
jgi:hypothetical protein